MYRINPIDNPKICMFVYSLSTLNVLNRIDISMHISEDSPNNRYGTKRHFNVDKAHFNVVCSLQFSYQNQ